MTTRTVAGFASFGPYSLPDACATSTMLLLCGSASPSSLALYRFRFADGQEPIPGARGIVQLTIPAGRPLPTVGPLPVWAGRIVGHVWGLHLLQRALPGLSFPPDPANA